MQWVTYYKKSKSGHGWHTGRVSCEDGRDWGDATSQGMSRIARKSREAMKEALNRFSQPSKGTNLDNTLILDFLLLEL